MNILTKVLRAGENRKINQYWKVVDKVNALSDEYKKMSDDELFSKHNDLVKRASKSNLSKAENDAITVEASALIRELSDRQLNKRLFDVQIIGALALNDGYVAEAKTGEGKSITCDTNVPTPDGVVKASDVKVGDHLFDMNGNPTEVTGVYPQGKKDVYVVHFEDGRCVKCSKDHIWSVVSGFEANNDSERDREFTVYLEEKTVEEMLEHGLTTTNDEGQEVCNFQIPRIMPVNYEFTSIETDPYLYGYILATLSSGNQSKIDELFEEFEKDIIDEIKELGIVNGEYRINPIYLFNNIDVRLYIIQGIMDACGNVYAGEKPFELYCISESSTLLLDMLTLLNSLGIVGVVNALDDFEDEEIVAAENKNILMFQSAIDSIDLFFMSIDCSEDIVYARRATRKTRRFGEIHPSLSIVSIEKLDQPEEQVCFMVDNPEHLFLVEEYIPTHNTVMSFLASYLNLIKGQQVHVVTVNEYLTERDSAECRKLLSPLNVKIGRIFNMQTPSSKQEAYSADVVYGTLSEFGFDYLRDNMVSSMDEKVQKQHQFAIIDEADSILIDEARTPLIISGQVDDSNTTYIAFASAVRGLKQDIDYYMDEGKKEIYATEEGLKKIEKKLGIDNIYDDLTGKLANHLNAALRATYMFHKDKDYIVTDGEVKIVDQFTGRIMEGRRWSEGIHQAIEAKEHVKIQAESQTLATITLQNYVRLYDKISGMTGTAITEDAEFNKTYKMGVVQIPTNKPVIRRDDEDLIYMTRAAKNNAILEEIKECTEKGQPVLLGTISVESSEELSNLLSKNGIKHEVLNAKNHAREAEIVAQAGRKGAVTIATNMAGRGTDIILGGNVEGLANSFVMEMLTEDEDGNLIAPTEEQTTKAYQRAQDIYDTEHEEVVAAGGLYVIGSERHESRRIDNQLRGRAGRQGDPGHSRFYISLEDDLMRLFGGDKIDAIHAMMAKSDFPEDVPLQAKMVSNSIERAQRQVENMNFEIRKNVLEYDDVMNQQRLAIYKERDAIIGGDDLRERIDEIITDTIWYSIDEFCPEKTPSAEWAWASIELWYEDVTDGDEWFKDFSNIEDIEFEDLVDSIKARLVELYEEKVKSLGDLRDQIERIVLINMLDTHWKNHLLEMDYVKSAAWMRSMGQRDPLTEYKNEAYSIFERLTENMYNGFLKIILHMQVEHTNQEGQTENGETQVNYSTVAEDTSKSTEKHVFPEDDVRGMINTEYSDVEERFNNIKRIQSQKFPENQNELEKAMQEEFVPPNDDELEQQAKENTAAVKQFFNTNAAESMFLKVNHARNHYIEHKPEHFRPNDDYTTPSKIDLDKFPHMENTESLFIRSERNVEHIFTESNSSAFPKDDVFDDVDEPEEDNNAANMPQSGKRKIGRNEPCPCGSGKKYKRCCGR